MSNPEIEILNLRKQIDAVQSQAAKLEYARNQARLNLESILDELNKTYGVNSIAEAEELLKESENKLRKGIEQVRRQLDAGMGPIT